jgi:Mg-chelatase subunit ChlD
MGAYKVIVLMTDGKANMPSGRNPETYALQQAQLAADAGIKILTISLGADADKSLMDQIAQTTDGIHFNIPGGQTVAEYTADLKGVFAQIAKERPLKLVK